MRFPVVLDVGLNVFPMTEPEFGSAEVTLKSQAVGIYFMLFQMSVV